MVRHRWGFASLADISGMKDGTGYDASTCSDRMDTIEDLIAKDDRVWAVWTMRGTHTGQLFGIPATGKRIEILEAGIWRLVDGLVIEAWFFGDELSLLRQLGIVEDPRLRAAASLARQDRLSLNASYGNWAVAAATLTTLPSDSPVTVTKHALSGLGSTSSCDSSIVPALEELSL
jgi:predicted ester cyclase